MNRLHVFEFAVDSASYVRVPIVLSYFNCKHVSVFSEVVDINCFVTILCR